MSQKIKFNKLNRSSRQSEFESETEQKRHNKRLSPFRGPSNPTENEKPAIKRKQRDHRSQEPTPPIIDLTKDVQEPVPDPIGFKEGVFFSNELKENEESESDDEEEYDLYKDIELVKFNFMSEEDVTQFGVVEVTDTRLSGPLPNSLYDLRMGPIDNKEMCETCENNCKAVSYTHLTLPTKRIV